LDTGHKKSSSGESEELSTILVNDCRAVNLTYLSCTQQACHIELVEIRDGIGTLYRIATKQVVKASTGHYPQPFLISDVKRTGAKVMRNERNLQIFQGNILKSHGLHGFITSYSPEIHYRNTTFH